MGLTNKHIVVTDGFVPDDTTALCISCVYPDSNGGNIRFVKDGDEIEIDFVKGKGDWADIKEHIKVEEQKWIRKSKKALLYEDEQLYRIK